MSEDSGYESVLPKLNAAEAAIQLHAKQMKKLRRMMQSVYNDGEAYVEHGRQMVAEFSVYAQELSSAQYPNLETARDVLKQVAELQSKFFDVMRDFNQFYSRDGIKVMEELEARASTSKTDLKRVEKLNDSLEPARKKLSKESEGSAKAKELKDTIAATQKSIIETGAEVQGVFDTLNKDMCKFGAEFHTAFYDSFGQMLNGGKEVYDDCEDQNNKLRESLGKAVKGESAPQTPTDGDGSSETVVEGNMGAALAELVDAERTQVGHLGYLERYANKFASEAAVESKPCIEEETAKEIFRYTKDIIAIHRELLSDIDFLGTPRKDLSAAEAEALKAKAHQPIPADKLLGYIYGVFNKRMPKMAPLYARYLEHVGIAQGTLEQAKTKKSFNSMLHKCQQQTVLYGMFPLTQLLPVVGRYFISVHKLLQCVMEAASEMDPAWMDFYEMLQKMDEMNKEFARIRNDSESVRILMGVQEKINDFTGYLADIGRVFIGEENFNCLQLKTENEEEKGPGAQKALAEEQTYHLMLFNDRIVITQKPTGMKQASNFILHENYNYIVDYPISNIVVMPIADTEDLKNRFRMTANEKCTIFWGASSESVRNEWVEKIRSAVLSWRSEQVFGASPEALMKRSASYEDGIVPHVFQDAYDYVVKNGLDLEGIFRISGNARTLEKLRLKLNTSHRIEHEDAFTAAVLMKQWLASLPVPIMQPHLYDDWNLAAEQKDKDKCIKSMTELVGKLPKLSKFILYLICDLCRKIVAKTDENRMSYHNLAIVFAPSLMRVPESQEFSATKRMDTIEKMFMLSEHIFPGVKESMEEASMQSAAYREVQAKRKREAVDAIRTKHIREKSVVTVDAVSAQEWMKKRKEELAAREQKEAEEAEARAKKEREEALAKQMEEYEARIREEEARKKEEEERKAKREADSRAAEEKARKDFEEHEKKVREMAEKAERAEREAQEREQGKIAAERKRRMEAAEARRKAAEAEAEAAAAKADEYDEDVCAGCGKPVDDDDEDAFESLDRLWHADCFCCMKCKKKLEDDDVKAKKGMPYCKDCYADLFCPICYGCNKPITGPILKALDTTWHKNCFVCVKCGKPITGDFTATPDGMPQCC